MYALNTNPTLAYQTRTIYYWPALGVVLGRYGVALGKLGVALGREGFALVLQGFLDTNMLVYLHF